MVLHQTLFLGNSAIFVVSDLHAMSKIISTPILFFLLLVGCRTEKENSILQNDNLSRFHEYVTQVSQGIISARSDVRVILNKPLKGWSKGDELDFRLLNVSLKVKGKVTALDTRTLAFIPENGFKQDTEYQFSVALKDIISDLPDSLETLIFSVRH